MTFDEYQRAARETALYPRHTSAVVYPALGLAGEAGEVANQVKKMIRDDKGELTNERHAKIIDELGDVMWYAAALASDLDMPLSEVCALNLDKLARRKAANALQGDRR